MAGLRDSRLLKGRGKGEGGGQNMVATGIGFILKSGEDELEVCHSFLPYELSSGKLRFMVRFRKF